MRGTDGGTVLAPDSTTSSFYYHFLKNTEHFSKLTASLTKGGKTIEKNPNIYCNSRRRVAFALQLQRRVAVHNKYL
jgi:hypothetical protein